MHTTSAGPIVQPGEGRQLPGIVFKVAAKHADGAFSIVEHPYPPGVLIPPHVHAAADQVTYVIEGEVGIRVGDDVFDALTGAYVIKPRGIPHTHRNASAHPARDELQRSGRWPVALHRRRSSSFRSRSAEGSGSSLAFVSCVTLHRHSSGSRVASAELFAEGPSMQDPGPGTSAGDRVRLGWFLSRR